LQGCDQTHGNIAGQRAVVVEPPSGRHLRGPGQRYRQELCLRPGEPGVRGHRVGHGAHDRPIRAFDSVAHRRLVAEIGLEDESERAWATARRAIDEVEVRGEDCVHPLLVVVSGGQGIPNRRDQCVGMSVDQRQVQLELAREMLVQHRF